MKLTGQKKQEINKEYSKVKEATGKRFFTHCLGVENFNADCNSATICRLNGNELETLCTIEELGNLIYELTLMKQAIENTTGVIIEVTDR